MKVIGITGGIGSGKSYIAKLICRNFPILHISTDDISRAQLMKGGSAYDGVVEAFGQGILREDGEVDRAYLGGIVFSDKEKLQLLNSLTHPKVLEEVHRIIGIVERGEVMSIMYGRPLPYKAVLVETAILKEAGYDSFCDEVWYVRAPKEDRIKRLMDKRNYSRERAESILASQADDAGYESYCTRIIDNPDSGNEVLILTPLREIVAEW